jgi:hypothetical protein
MDMKFLRNEYTKIILGILWGFGLACIFRTACNGRNCIIYKAPKHKEVIENIYSSDKKCYKYETVNTECNKDAIDG